jgi:hypothetical protein
MRRLIGIILGVSAIAVASTAAAFSFLPDIQLRPIVYSAEDALKEQKPVTVPHEPVPQAVKAIYLSQCGATVAATRKRIISIADTTEVNSVVLDIKDYTGTISYTPKDPLVKQGGKGCRISDIDALLKEFHDHHIYVIGRITVFQDPYLTGVHPEWAVKSRSRADGIWRDKKGLAFFDVGAKGYWDVVVALAVESYGIGFDELNFDYVRFPSDGNMADALYSLSTNGPGGTKADNLEHFFQYLSKNVRDKTKEKYGASPMLSADLFGMTATNTDDLTIGQVLERAVPYFDAVAPMVYPSHYPTGFNGWKNPNEHVYGVIKFSMDRAVERTKSELTTVKGFMHTPVEGRKGIYKKESYPATKLRTWIQDFNYGGIYGEKEIRDEFRATYDAGLTSWMIWNPASRYTTAALNKE